MPYLKIAQDQSVVMTIKSVGQEYERHWVGHQYIECAGEGCQLCGVELDKTRARNLEVLVGDQAKTWSCPGGAFTNLVALVGSSEGLVGREVTVKRVQEQNRTIYKSYLTGLSERYKSDDEITYITPEVSVILRALDAVICDQRFADLLGEKLK